MAGDVLPRILGRGRELRRRCVRIGFFLILSGVVGLCGSVLAVGLFLARPLTAVIGPPPETLPGADSVRIASASGSSLSGWWIAGRPRGGAVVLMHGVRSNRTSMIRRAIVLHQQGFSVLLFDFQSHGESPGGGITFGRLEARDAAAAVAFVRARLPGERIAAIGVSVGGAAAVLGEKPLPVDALVLESVYPNIDSALSNRLRTHLGKMIGAMFTPLLTPLFKSLLPPLLGVSPGDLRPVDRIGTVTAPVLVASGTHDTHTTIAEAAALFAHAPEPKQYWAAPGATHADLERQDPEAYWRVVLPFLNERLRRDH